MNEKYELTDKQIGEIYDEPCDWALPHMITFARAIITADRALRPSPAVGDVAMPVVVWATAMIGGSNCTPCPNRPEAIAETHVNPLVKQADAQAALAAKDAEIAQLKERLGIKPDALQKLTLKHMGRELDKKIAEITTLTAERDALKAARYAYAGEFSEGADGERDVGSIHANIRALKADRDALHECTNEYDAWIRFNDAGNGSYPDFLAAMTKEPK
jgi:hypothetical protein